jgi:hypothetical protein
MTPIEWTPTLVGYRLVEAFRLLPGRPVMSSARGFTIDGGEVEPFGWPERFLPELRDRRILMTWASCRAQNESVRARFDGFGWERSTAEKRLRRALATIAAGLSLNATRETSS